MGRHPFEDELDRVLSAGPDAPPEADELLGILVRDLRTAFAAVPTSGDAHVDAITEASKALAHTRDPAAPPRGRRNAARDTKVRPVLRVAVAAFATLILFSGMAFAGVLPRPLQDAANTVGRWVGFGNDDRNAPKFIDPDGDQGGDAGTANDDPEEGDAQDEDGDRQGEGADDQGDDEKDVTDGEQGEQADDDQDGGSGDADDDQGEDADDQGEDADDQGEDADDQDEDDEGDDDGDGSGDDQDEDEDEDADEDRDDQDGDDEDDQDGGDDDGSDGDEGGNEGDDQQ